MVSEAINCPKNKQECKVWQKLPRSGNVVINKDDLKHWKCEDEENLAMEVFIKIINLTEK
ncbi:hypothetical protein CXF58_12120 [Psychrobacter sp. Sarcosine-02u-2]|nr:hypothetical protein CXF58_12120 [Psychrobacter sp. Sarcosine-02u-2]HCR87727.1 hypothetical protein [Psychrobacter sp.]